MTGSDTEKDRQQALVACDLQKGLPAMQRARAFCMSNTVGFCCNNIICCNNMSDKVSELGVSLGGRGGVGGVCQGCKEACYCSRECQLQLWAAGHKDVCQRLQARR